MPERQRTYTTRWVQGAIRGEIRGRDASAARSLAEQCPGPSMAVRIADAMTAWVYAEQSGDPDRLDFWPELVRLVGPALCEERAV